MPDATITITFDKGNYTFTTNPPLVGGVLAVPNGGAVQFDAVGAASITVNHTGPDPFTTSPIVATTAGASYTLSQTGGFTLTVAGTSSPTLDCAPVFGFTVGTSPAIELGAGGIVQFETPNSMLPLTITTQTQEKDADLFVGQTGGTFVLTTTTEQRTVSDVEDNLYTLFDGSPLSVIPIIGTINVSTKK